MNTFTLLVEYKLAKQEVSCTVILPLTKKVRILHRHLR